MKKYLTASLQVATLFIGIAVIAGMARFPLTEGRAASLDLFSIYRDPFIIYMYASSILFFVALYQIFRLLGYIRKNKAFSLSSVKALRIIKYCAIILCILIVIAILYIGMFHNKDDDPAGFIAIGILATFISAIVAVAASVFERVVQNAVKIKSENELTV